MKHHTLWLALSMAVMACTDGTLFHRYKPLPAEGWDRRDTVRFDLPQAEEDIRGTLTIGLRTIPNIGIRDIVLVVEQCDSLAHIRQRDTLHYPLTDAEGYALTGGVNHHQYETQHVPIRLQKGESGHICISHLMRHEEIAGITEVGIRIDR